MNIEYPPIILVKTWLSLRGKNYSDKVRNRANHNIINVFKSLELAEIYVVMHEQGILNDSFEAVKLSSDDYAEAS